MIDLLPIGVVIVLVLCICIGIGGLGLWVGCLAMENLVRLIRRTLAADLRLQRMKQKSDRAALDYWIRDSFRWKDELMAQGDVKKELEELQEFLSEVGVSELPGQAVAGRRIRHA